MSTSPRTQSPGTNRSVRCTVCRKEFHNLPRGLQACPNCGTQEDPQTLDHDIVIRLNWKDMRVLVIWADEFVRRENVRGPFLAAWVSLVDYIRKFQPEGAPGLTLYEDAEAGRLAGYDVYITRKPWGET